VQSNAKSTTFLVKSYLPFEEERLGDGGNMCRVIIFVAYKFSEDCLPSK
jgi:hypothetical protein